MCNRMKLDISKHMSQVVEEVHLSCVRVTAKNPNGEVDVSQNNRGRISLLRRRSNITGKIWSEFLSSIISFLCKRNNIIDKIWSESTFSEL